MSPVVLVTGARSPAALEFARALRALGAEPHLADSAPARVARWSTAPAKVHRYAPPLQEPHAFQRDISRIVAEIDPVAVVPTCEEVFHLAAPGLAQALAGRLRAPSLDILHRLHRKDSFAALATALGLSAPETHVILSTDDLKRFLGREQDWVFKPCYSRFGSRAVVAPRSIEDLRFGATEPWIAQRRVIGDEVCFYAMADGGQVRAFAAYRADWQMPGGASYAFAPLDQARSNRLRTIAERLAHALEIVGQFACDCILDRDGRYWLIECNPRSTSGVHLCPEKAARAVLGWDIPDVACGQRHNLPMMLSYGVGSALRTASLGRWLVSLWRGSDVVSGPGDRRPILGALVDAADFMLSARRLGVSLAAATTLDIEWNGSPLP